MMKTMKPAKITNIEIVDLIDHKELLLLFRNYVDECIENCGQLTQGPLSFDDWHRLEYLPNIESLTQVIKFNLNWYLGRSSWRCQFHARHRW